jgi:dCMP deaminase|tara:strand:+ start:1120 stop:1551 length:432 start_codon:yes stop_codon:yes gene_type:complete
MLALCNKVATASPDSKQVGCVITSPKGEVLVTACNDFVHGAAHTSERLQRPTKYHWIEHAERNAIYKAAAAGIPLKGAIMHINWWPCVDCCRAIIQSGITKIISSRGPDFDHPRWGEQFRVVQQILDESDVKQVILVQPRKRT